MFQLIQNMNLKCLSKSIIPSPPYYMHYHSYIYAYIYVYIYIFFFLKHLTVAFSLPRCKTKSRLPCLSKPQLLLFIQSSSYKTFPTNHPSAIKTTNDLLACYLPRSGLQQGLAIVIYCKHLRRPSHVRYGMSNTKKERCDHRMKSNNRNYFHG